MKFKLFQRLRSNDNTGSSPASSPAAQDGLGEPDMGEAPQTEGSLGRTVESMFDQGYSEEEIKQELQGQYSEQEIQKAVNEAVRNNATPNDGPEPMQRYGSDDQPVSPMDEGFSGEGDPQAGANQSPPQGQPPASSQQPPPQEPQQAQQPQSQPEPLPEQGGGERSEGPVDQRVEELIETIVAENFQRVTEEFENVYSELDLIEERLEDLDDRIHDLEVRDDEDQEQFVQKVEEMEEHIDSYQSRIGGLEKAFQQVLPNLVENVRDLTSLVQEIKQEKGIETQTDISKQEVDAMDEELEDW